MVPPPPPARAHVAHQPELDNAEAEEDRLDAEEGRAAIAEFRSSGERAVPLDEVLAEHGLTRADLPG